MLLGLLICTALLALLHLAVPFWGWVLVVPFAYAAVREPQVGRGLAIGALSAGGLWLVMAAVLFLGPSARVAERVAAMVGTGAPVLLPVVTGVLGLLAGGLAGAAGSSVRHALRRRP